MHKEKANCVQALPTKSRHLLRVLCIHHSINIMSILETLIPALHEGVENVDGHGKYDRGVVLSRDAVQSL